MKRGDVYIANINPRSGSEQIGIRPVIIISHDGFNLTQNWKSIIIVPISTSQKQSLRTPTTVSLSSGSGGLEKDSIALCHQITTLDKSKLQKKLGTLSENEIKEVEQSIKFSLGMY